MIQKPSVLKRFAQVAMPLVVESAPRLTRTAVERGPPAVSFGQNSGVNEPGENLAGQDSHSNCVRAGIAGRSKWLIAGCH